ncbi:MAG: FAD-dependent oxidoreductase [Planctomycetes bacterium]|nr:FAD-dependent oxidoreductase [Planctomycetota bacterium]
MSRQTVGHLSDLQQGQMKQVEVDDVDLLLVRLGDGVRALAATCPHHGAPLGEGLLHDGHILCPWHMATFDAEDGSLQDPPSLEGLPQFPVTIEGEDIIVDLPDDPPASCAVSMAEHDPDADGRTFVILGAGAAGMTAAEALRQNGFAGNIVMLTHENDPPYDRTDLSKPYLRSDEPAEPTIRGRDFYEQHGIELRTGFEAANVDILKRRVTSAGGEEVTGDKLLLATGGTPRTLDVPGADLIGVMTLRTYADAKELRRRMGEAKRAVVVGASFIGMEVASGLVEQGMDVTVVAPETVPFKAAFGEAIGRMYQTVHEDKGVTFKLGRTVGHFAGDDFLEAVVLDDGSTLRADVAVLGVGVRPETDYLKPDQLNSDGSVTVNSYLQITGDVFAAGDIASFADWRTGQSTRIEHWRVAQQQGIVAARNMLGAQSEYRRVPFFWTNQYMVITDYLGHAAEWDEVVVDGDIEEQDFLAFYIKDEGVHAVAGCGRSRAIAACLELMEAQPLPTLQRLRAEMAKLI